MERKREKKKFNETERQRNGMNYTVVFVY